MPYKVTYADGTTLDTEEEPEANHWARQPARWRVVKCEWVEPRKEYRWVVTVESGGTLTVRTLDEATRWTAGNPEVVKVERIEVTT